MSRRLQLDPIRCTAHGMCAEILPERVELDDWGYPILDATPLDAELVSLASRAVATCPVLALRLATDAAPERPSSHSRPPRLRP